MIRLHKTVLGIVLLAASIVKRMGGAGIVEVIGTQAPDWPAWVLWSITMIMIVMETVLGVLLLTDRWTALGALLAFLLLMGNFGLLALALLRGMAVPNCGLFVVFLIQPLEPARIMEVLAVAGLTGGLYLLVRGEAVDISETEPGFSSWQISRSSSGTDSVSVLIRRTMLSVMQPLDGQKTRSAFYVYVRDLDDVHRRAI